MDPNSTSVLEFEDQRMLLRHGRPVTAPHLWFRCTTRLTAAGLAHRPLHSLGDAFASLQYEAGEDMATISKILAHASLSTTMDIYADLSPRTQGGAAERLDRVLTG